MKPNMEPGDFILWDSRAVHYGAAPLGTNKRMAICKGLRARGMISSLLVTDTCYKPIEFLSEEQRERKVEAFKRGYMTVSLCKPKLYGYSSNVAAVSRPDRLCAEGGANGRMEHSSSIWKAKYQQRDSASYWYGPIRIGSYEGLGVGITGS